MHRNFNLRFVIIGAGMSGILAAIRLRESGFRDVTVLEKADRVGGTWRENRYPGLTCDVPAHAYTYSFARNPGWSAFYAPGGEIQTYFEKIARDHGVVELTRFNQEVVSVEWDQGAWHLRTSSGEMFVADVVIAASGVLHHPRYPEIEGLDNFEGQMCHSARWDDSIALEDKRIGVIGTGSTGVQLVTAMAPRARRVSHFQRSPQWIMPVKQKPYTDEQRAAFLRDPSLIEDVCTDRDYEAGVMRFTTGITNPDAPEMHEIEELCRQNLEENVLDPELRERLRPTYRAACKRLVFSWNYYEIIQRYGVDVVTGPIQLIESGGIRTRDGKLHELDVLVLATGFRADRFIRPAVVRGRGGKSLDDFWLKRPTAYFAVSLPDFPNLFFLNGPTAPVGNFSLIDVAERQWVYIAQLIDRLTSGACSEICVSAAAMADYDRRRIEAARGTIFASGCTSWYLDAEGVPVTWPWTYDAFAKAMQEPNLADYDQTLIRKTA